MGSALERGQTTPCPDNHHSAKGPCHVYCKPPTPQKPPRERNTAFLLPWFLPPADCTDCYSCMLTFDNKVREVYASHREGKEQQVARNRAMCQGCPKVTGFGRDTRLKTSIRPQCQGVSRTELPEGGLHPELARPRAIRCFSRGTGNLASLGAVQTTSFCWNRTNHQPLTPPQSHCQEPSGPLLAHASLKVRRLAGHKSCPLYKASTALEIATNLGSTSGSVSSLTPE